MKKALIVLFAMAFVAVFTLPAMAADKAEWSFYGMSRFETRSSDVETSDWTGTNDPLRDDRDTTWDLTDGSRIGARGDWGHIMGRFEWGYNDGDLAQRHLYGIWRWHENGFLLIGQSYTPTAVLISNAHLFDGLGMIDMGAFYAGRVPQIKIEHNWGAFHAEIAFLRPASGTNSANDFQSYFTTINAGGEDNAHLAHWNSLNAAEQAAVPGLIATTRFAGEDDDNAAEADTTLPKIEAMIRYNFGPLTARLFGGWNEYEMTINIADGDNNGQEVEVDVDSWVVGTVLEFAMGPFYAKGTVYTGENLNDYGCAQNDALSVWWDPGVNAADGVGTLYDVDDWGWLILAGFKVNDMLSFEAGYGEVESDLDATYTDAAGDGNPFSLQTGADRWYVNATITLAQGVSIIPEVGHTDNQEYDFRAADYGYAVDDGDETFYGITWKVNF